MSHFEGESVSGAWRSRINVAFSSMWLRVPVCATTVLLLLAYDWNHSAVQPAWYARGALTYPGYMWARLPRELAGIAAIEILNPPLAVLSYLVPRRWQPSQLGIAYVYAPAVVLLSGLWWFLIALVIVARRSQPESTRSARVA